MELEKGIHSLHKQCIDEQHCSTFAVDLSVIREHPEYNFIIKRLLNSGAMRCLDDVKCSTFEIDLSKHPEDSRLMEDL